MSKVKEECMKTNVKFHRQAEMRITECTITEINACTVFGFVLREFNDILYVIGSDWFSRMETTYPSIEYPTKSDMMKVEQQSSTVNRWLEERNRYIFNNNSVPLPWSKQGMFIVESGVLATKSHGGLRFKVVVSLA